jgi:hypothetical protein
MFCRRSCWSAGELRETSRLPPETAPVPAHRRAPLRSQRRVLRAPRPWSTRQPFSLTGIGRRCPFRGVAARRLGQMSFDCSTSKSGGGLSTLTCLKRRRTSLLIGRVCFSAQHPYVAMIQSRERGGTGRRAGLRILSRKGSGFDSRRSHFLLTHHLIPLTKSGAARDFAAYLCPTFACGHLLALQERRPAPCRRSPPTDERRGFGLAAPRPPAGMLWDMSARELF